MLLIAIQIIVGLIIDYVGEVGFGRGEGEGDLSNQASHSPTRISGLS